MPSLVALSDIPRSKFDRLKQKFSCKNPDLEKYIKQFAYSHQREGLFQTYFYVDDNDNFLGYISVAVATIERTKFADELDISYSIPVDKMMTFCKIFGQDDLVEILRK